ERTGEAQRAGLRSGRVQRHRRVRDAEGSCAAGAGRVEEGLAAYFILKLRSIFSNDGCRLLKSFSGDTKTTYIRFPSGRCWVTSQSRSCSPCSGELPWKTVDRAGLPLSVKFSPLPKGFRLFCCWICAASWL